MKTDIMSFQYRAMIYFAHSTMVIYGKDIASNELMSVNQFRNENEELVQRVFDEGLNIFNYELSSNQMAVAIRVYLNSKYNPSSVFETEAYKLP